ncbi:MAG: insulinase family protein [Crocinitomicaceae bacterium]
MREKYGYSYNIEANYTPYVDTGFWSIYLGTDEKYLQKSINLVRKELKNSCDTKMGTLQLNQAKKQLKRQIALSLEGNAGLMLGLGKSLLLFNQIDTIPDIYKEIDNLTASDILHVANTYFGTSDQNELIYALKK